MICFEVSINGKRVCLAGIGDSGVLSTIVNWVNGNHDRLDIHVGGLTQIGINESQHVSWIDQQLIVGDEVSIRIVESVVCDEPDKDKVRFEGCLYCGKSRSEGAKLISGSYGFLCFECVEVCTKIISEGGTGALDRVGSEQENRCSFCGKTTSEVPKLMLGLSGNICNQCVGICNLVVGTKSGSDSA